MSKILVVLLLVFTSISSSQNFWESTNGPYTHELNQPVNVTAINISKDEKIFVGVGGQGLYYSVDNGNSFSYLNGTLSNTSISSILIDQHGNIFVGNTNYCTDTSAFRSTDNGYTWTQLPIGHVSILISDPLGYIYAATNDALYRSIDDGNSWIKLNSIAFSPPLGVNSNGDIFVSGAYNGWTGCFRSSDQGETWVPLSIPSPSSIMDISEFAFAPNGNIVASVSYYAGYSGLLISNNNGNSWTPRNVTNYKTWNSPNIIFDSTSSSFYAVFTDSLYNGSNFFRSTDYGNTWSIISNMPGIDNLEFIQISQSGFLYASNGNILIRSSDYGSSWTKLDSGFFAASPGNLTLMPGGKIFISSDDENCVLTNNNMGWLLDNSAYVGSFIVSNSGNYILADGMAIYQSTDKGNTWTDLYSPVVITSNLTKSSNGYILFGGYFAFIQNDFFNSKFIMRSTDDGKTWNLSYEAIYDSVNQISTMATTPNGVILAGGGSNAVMRSTDSGTTWTSSTNGLPSNITCNKLSVRPDGNVFMISGSNGMFRSSDDGMSWSAINNGLSSLTVTSIAMNSDGKVFVGTSGGVFESTNSGDNWTPLNSGLLDLDVTSILCDSSGYLYATTNSTGVYRSIGITTGVKSIKSNIPLTYALYQNYPNPFNPSTTINFNLPKSGHVTIKVFDILGREVATLVNEEKNAGSYSAEFNAGRFASGIYLYRMQAGNFVQTKKLILLK